MFPPKERHRIWRLNATPGQTRELDLIEKPVLDRRPLRDMLGLLLCQAWLDGMTRIELRADPRCDAASQRDAAPQSSDPRRWTPTLRYIGPRDAASPQTWDMIPPPIETYNGLVQVIINECDYPTGCGGVGAIYLAINGQPVRAEVLLRSWHDLELRLEPAQPTPA